MTTRHLLSGRATALAFFLIFGSLAAQDSSLDYFDATLRNWVQPAYPDAAKKAKLEGRVLVEFAVDAEGHVTDAQVIESSDPMFNDVSLTAVKKWVLAPAIEAGKPAASAMRVEIEFRLAQLKQKQAPIAPARTDLLPVGLKLTPAKAKSAPDPDYPPELEDRKLPGEVQMEFTVGPDGRAQAPRVLWASHAAFVEMALRAVEHSEFTPAHQGSINKTTTIQYPVVFDSFGAKTADILAANHLTFVGDAAPDTPPKPVVVIEPVYPREKLLSGKTGSAEAEFTIGERGLMENVTVTAASEPEFGAALAAAVEAWMFRPATTGGARVSTRMKVTYEFALPTDGNAARLIAALQPDGAGVAGPAGLDQRLKPLWRGFPVYPAALKSEHLTGDAEIEFIIDRGGRARMVRVVSATREEFGWAAATAISQWVFERPIRQGEPTDVKVSIPVNFKPPGS